MIAIDQDFMLLALQQAELARQCGEVPVGAVIVLDNEVIATGYNQTISLNDPTAHAEIMAMRAAGKDLNNYRFLKSTLYVTLEPCPMCVGAMVHARIERLAYGAPDPKTGACHSALSLLSHPSHNHKISVTEGILTDPCSTILTDFFREKR